MNNIDQFIDYLLGKAEFPYFKDLPEVPLPRIYQEDPADLAHELEVEAELEREHDLDVFRSMELIQDQQFRWGEPRL